jgi:hypothetical protein
VVTVASTLRDDCPDRLEPAPRRRRRLRALAGLELVTGVMAVVGGLLLAIAP